jgi:hypothetical protein
MTISELCEHAARLTAGEPNSEIRSVDIANGVIRLHVSWPYFQQHFAGQEMREHNGHVSLKTSEGVIYTAIMRRPETSVTLIFPEIGGV